MIKKKTKHYVNNRTLFGVLIRYKNEVNEASEKGLDPPKIPDYVGLAIYQICNKLVIRPNFSGYTIQYKQEMISDALVDCVAAINNFDPERTNNPFAYFTQIAWNACVRRIQKEKKQQYIKLKNVEKVIMLENCSEEEINQFKLNDASNELVRSYEEKNIPLKKKEKVLLVNDD
jgi:DNA-directed RNA polymerase specialized sigma24 family protein